MKKLLGLVLLITACGTTATSHNFIGCNWHIPAGFKKLSENEYRKFPANEDLNTSFSSVIMSETITDDLTTLTEMNKMPDTEVLVISYPEDNNYSYESIFIKRKTRFGDSISNDTLRVSQKNQAVGLVSLSQTDSFHLTSECVSPEVIEQHYAVLAQLAQGVDAFLNTKHGFNILVPQAN